MLTTLTQRIKGYILAILSLFNKKNRVSAVISPSIETVSQPTIAPISASRSTVRHSTAPFVRLNDITSMLDQEAVELYGRGTSNPHGKRNPFVRE